MTHDDIDQAILSALRARAATLQVAPFVPPAPSRRAASARGRLGGLRVGWVAAFAVLVLGGVGATVVGVGASRHGTGPGPASAGRAYPLPWVAAGNSPDSPGARYALPLGGQSPGAGEREHRVVGLFHATVIDGQACAWIGDTPVSTLWPAGWSLRLDPVTLVAGDGASVAHEGDLLQAAETVLTASSSAGGGPCGATGSTTVVLNSVTRANKGTGDANS